MVEVDLDTYEGSDISDDEDQYSKLAYSVSQLDSTQRVKPPSRKELTTDVSEFNLNKQSTESDHVVDVKELAEILKKKSSHKNINKNLESFTGTNKTLSKPLEKPEAEKIKRQIGYTFVKDRFKKWNAIVDRNRLEDHLVFPLQQNEMSIQDNGSFFEKFEPMTSLEKQFSDILLKKDYEKEDEDDTLQFPLTLEEIIERRKEMANIRARQSYKEAKAQRQNKIKSKKYHRILKREKIKEQMKEFEQLQRTDPEAALKKLIEIDKIRAQERASLRHRNTGKWAKNLQVRAKYDRDTRKILADQLSVSRDLTKKVRKTESDEEENDEGDDSKPSKMFDDSTDNPWNIDLSSEVKEFVSGYRKYWEAKNKESSAKENSKDSNSILNASATSEGISEKKSNNDQSGSEIVLSEEKEGRSLKKLKRKKNDEKVNSKKVKLNSSKESIRADKAKSKKNKTPEKKKSENQKYVLDCNFSGLWIVSPVKENEGIPEKNTGKGKKKEPGPKKNNASIDDLFERAEKNLEKRIQQKLRKVNISLTKESEEKGNTKQDSDSEDDQELSVKNFRNNIQRPDEDVELSEVPGRGMTAENEKLILPAGRNATTASKISSFEIDPKKYIHVKPKALNTKLPDEVMQNDDVMDDDQEQKMTIMEAFADDDVVAEFKEMKEQEAKSTELTELVPTLPGWGDWGGTGLLPRKRKKPRKMLDVPLPPRKDQDKEDVIINEDANPKLKNHMVKQLPYPFTSTDDFEANVRAPLGRDWVPETAHQKLIEKPVETKIGTVIEPMNAHNIYKMEKEIKSAFQKKQKEKIIYGTNKGKK